MRRLSRLSRAPSLLPSLPPLLAVLLAWGLAACGPGEAPPPPDVVLIDLDSVRADHVEHLGYRLPTTRGIDAFRSRAVLFGTARSPSSASAPATAALLTGLSPTRLGRPTPDAPLPDGPTTLAEALGAAGYATLGRSQHSALSPEAGFDRGFESFVAPRGDPLEHPDSQEAVDWLREWLAADPPRPAFLYLHLMDAHPPYRVPRAHRAALLGRPPSDALPWGGARMQAAQRPGRRRARSAIGEREIRSLEEQYDTALRYAFDRTGQILGLLDQAGRLDGALVVITSSHGQELLDHEGFGHGRTLFDEVLRVPLYVKLPGAVAADAPPLYDLRVSTLDVMPTILDMLGLPLPDTDGRSLAPLLRGESEDLPERDLFFAVEPAGPLTLHRALLRDRYKLIEAVGATRLHDLTLDPGEQHNLAADNKEILFSLRRDLSRAFEAGEVSP